MSEQHHETPLKRTNPSGKTVWVARYTGRSGKRRSAGTFTIKRDAQAAITKAYRDVERGLDRVTVAAYLPAWLREHPRAQRTNDTNQHRIRRVLAVEIEGRELGDWPLMDLRRRHVNLLVDHLLREQGRSARGATNILRALSAMFENAIGDDIADSNPVRGVMIRQTDPRVTKQPRQVRVFSFAEMHAFARLAGHDEVMVRCVTDLGVRLGELLALQRADFHQDEQGGWVMEIRHTAHEGVVQPGTKTDHGQLGAGREAPVPPGLVALLQAMPRRIDSMLLFPTPMGKVWRERNFYRDVWDPARAAWLRERGTAGPRPHECRHSYITHLSAQGIDRADLAAIAGHTVDTMTKIYTHPLNESDAAVRKAIG